MGGTAPTVDVLQPKEQGVLQVPWVHRALWGPQASQVLLDFQDRRGREESKAQQELLDFKEVLDRLASLVFQV